METPHSHENGLHSIPDTEHVREKEPRLKKPDNFFQYFHERLAAIDLDKFSSLQTAYSRWIMYEFTESAGDGLRDFSEKNKDHKDVYSKNLFSFIGYGLVSEISKEAYGILDNIGASDAHPDLDAQILLIADRILDDPDNFFANLFKTIAKLRDKAGYSGPTKGQNRTEIFQSHILRYAHSPAGAFGGFGTLPIGVARELYGIGDEYEQIFKLGRLGAKRPSITSWEGLRYRTATIDHRTASQHMHTKGKEYWEERKKCNSVLMLSYYDVTKRRYVSRPTAVKHITNPIVFDKSIKNYEKACVNDFFRTLLNADVMEGELPKIADIADIIKYFAEPLIWGQQSELGEIMYVNSLEHESDYSADFSTEAILEEFEDNLPTDIQFLLSHDRKCYIVRSHNSTAEGDSYLVELFQKKSSEEGIRMMVSIGNNPRSFKCKTFRRTPDAADNDHERGGGLYNWGRYYMPESEFFITHCKDGQVLHHSRDCDFESNLYNRIQKVAQSFLAEEDEVSIEQEARGEVRKVLVESRSSLLTRENIPFYVAAVSKFIFDVIYNAARGRSIDSHSDLCIATDGQLDNESDIWNLVDCQDFHDYNAASERNQVFLTCPVSYPEARDFDDNVSLNILKENLYQSHGVYRSVDIDENVHAESVLEYFLQGGNSWSKRRMCDFFELDTKKQDVLLRLFRYINDADSDDEKLLRLKQVEFYKQLLFWGHSTPDIIEEIKEDDSKMDPNDSISFYANDFLETTDLIFTRKPTRKRMIGMLAIIDDMPGEMKQGIIDFWQYQINQLPIIIEKICDLSKEEGSKYAQLKYNLAKVVLIINSIATKLGIEQMPAELMERLQEDWDEEYGLDLKEDSWFEQFAKDQKNIDQDLALSRGALQKRINGKYKRKSLDLQQQKMDFILSIKDEVEFLRLWTVDYKAAHSDKDIFHSVVLRLSKNDNFPYLIDLLFLDENRWNDEGYGDVLIDVYGKLSDGQQLEFLEELNILQFFYNDSHSDLIEGPEVDIQIPKAAMKLHDHIKQSDDEQLAHVTDLATKRIIGHSKLMHKKRILGRHYGEYPKDRNYKVEIIL